MRNLKKLLSLLLALTMVLGMVNLSAFAAEEGESEPVECTCTAKCTEDSVNSGCPVCGAEDADLTACKGEVTEEPKSCTCETKCTEDNANTECPVCSAEGADLTACKGKEEEKLTVEFDDETATLTITGKGDVTAELVKAYTGKMKHLDVTIKGEIKEQAFYWNSSLETVIVNGATSIGHKAFFGAKALKRVELSNVEQLEEIPTPNDPKIMSSNTFAECKVLESVTLKNVGFVGAEAFRQCSALTSDGLKMTKVGGFGRSPFSYCAGLTTLELDGSNGNLGTLGVTMFYYCTGLTSVTLKNVDAVPVQMFNGCTALETVTIENVSSIGQQPFLNCTKLENIDLKNVTTIGEMAFLSAAMKNITLENVSTIGKNAFASCKNLESVTMTGSTDTIGQYAFWNCSALETINSLSNVTGRIGGFAFYGCKSLTGLTVADMTKMGFIGSNEEIMDRVQAILAGKFQLDNAKEIKKLERDETNWPAGEVGKSGNWDQYDNGTQLMEQARWQDTSAGVAQVKVDAYYTGEKQMDYIFVADLSASMAQLGNPEDGNARFYDMQSKLLDMTSKLLGTPGYDCQVAIVTFGGYFNNAETHNTLGFTKDLDAVQNHIKALEPLNENTDYGLGLGEALKVVQSQVEGRNTVVVFLSDGYPTVDKHNDGWGTLAATQIKKAKVPIYGVLHSPAAASHDKALEVMNAVCGKGNVYESTDTESFGKAMNAAFTATYGNNTVTVPVNAKEFDVSDLSATAGTAVYDEKSGTITWTLNGMPFTQHTLTYNLTLKSELANRVGTYTYRINNGPARFGKNGASVDLDTAANKLSLTRTVNAPYVPSIPDTTPPTTNIEDENPPLANVDGLNLTDHFSYIAGYPDGTVRPEANITRAEAATIFFRLMTEEYRVANWATTNDFPDVKADEWYNVAISVAAKAGIVKGYPDGTFKPDEPITRAEFATMAARFMTDDVTDDVGDFADTVGHWAAETIRKAVKAGWVRGKSSTEFDPEANITRAEVVTMVNRMLDRCFVPDAAHMLDTMKTWPDNKDTSAWYYLDIQEAGNGHNYKMEENVETWTELVPTDWAAKEAEWVANNGASAKTEK